MRKRLVLALLLASACSAATVDSLARLRALFPNPPAEFSTLPFFVWNGEMTEQMIDRELRDFSEQRVRGFIIHPRPVPALIEGSCRAAGTTLSASNRAAAGLLA